MHRLNLGAILMQVPICMASDLVNLSTKSYKQFEFDEMEGKKDIEWFIEHYVPKVKSYTNYLPSCSCF